MICLDSELSTVNSQLSTQHMAIIKCPECGHQISDKAPTCPSCGVEIAGHITRCPQCGTVYLNEQDSCPICHHANDAQPIRQSFPTTPPPIPTAPREEMQQQPEQPPKKKKRSWGALLFSLFLALVICGVCFYFYHNAKDTKETEAYTYAMTSSDPLVLQSFLDTYRDASASRRDSIQSRLTAIQQADRDWNNACMSQSKTELEEFIKKYPDSPHKGEAHNKIDSIDWAKAKADNTVESYHAYQVAHPNGKFLENADELIKELEAKTLQPEEEEIVHQLFKRFFQGVNSRNTESIGGTLADILKNFQGIPDATREQVINYVYRLWKPNVENMNWYILNDYQIDKKEVGADQYEYITQFTTNQKVTYNDGSKDSQQKFRIHARVNAEFRIVEFNVSKLME